MALCLHDSKILMVLITSKDSSPIAIGHQTFIERFGIINFGDRISKMTKRSLASKEAIELGL